MRSWLAKAVLFAAAVGLGYAAGWSWPHSRRASFAPTIEQVQALSSLVTTRVVVADVRETAIRGRLGGVRAAILLRGDVLLEIDLARARFLSIDPNQRSAVLRLPSGEYQKDHEPFMDWYATPTHVVTGPNGWPTYVAKGDLGIAPVEEDGSVAFCAPAGKVLYFQVLDKDYNELQRMRSVIQLQPGERRGCIGCHESRASAPAVGVHPLALRREPSRLAPPPWGAGPFSYEKVVQPVWDAKCIRCHDAGDARKVDLSGRLDKEKVPASYRTLIEQGWVHYFDCQWGQEHNKAAPATFGTLRSRLWPLLDAGHYEVKLTQEEKQRIKCWIDLNCPLWPDYVLRSSRPGPAPANP